MADNLKLEIVTPSSSVLSDDVHYVVFQALQGQLTILPHHTRLMTQLVPGEMIICRNGREEFMAVGGGIAKINEDTLSILTDMAISVESIDETKAEEARNRAAARLREKLSSEEVASVNAALARSLAQLNVKRRRRR
ncbi:MAG: ATP synthase F1 subunit epsilon [Candidatus Korobacteraceae bacterium]